MIKIRDMLYRNLDKLDLSTGQALKMHTLILTMGLLATGILLILVFAYWALACPPMIMCALLGVVACALCCLLAKKGKYDAAGLLMIGGILLTIVADDYFVGNANNSILYLFTVLVASLLFPFSRKTITVTVCVALPVATTVLFILGHNHTPPYPPAADLMHIFAIINIFVTSSGVILLVGLSRQIGHYVDDYSSKKIAALQDQSHHDALTQMYNRHYADLYLEQLKAENTPRDLCIAIADLDNFKKVNDTYGHNAGDTTLRQISSLIHGSLRHSDVVVRWGGEEFVIILHDVVPANAHTVLDKIRNLVENHTITHEDLQFKITVTIGLSTLDLADVEGSLKSCDQKLYVGKQGGKNMVVV